MPTTEKNITIIKLGGSCFSDKKVPRSLHVDVIDGVCKQLEGAGFPLIVVHGGGSYGHPVAKRYGIHLGWQEGFGDQSAGFCETHEAMVELNHAIVGQCLKHGIPAFAVQTSAVFLLEGGAVSSARLDAVDALLDQGLVPVLYGDAVVDTSRGFGIMSGDAIIVELANRLKHRVDRIVYLMDVDGLFDKDPRQGPGARLIPDVVIEGGELFVPGEAGPARLEDVVQQGGASIDVTGGIIGKLRALAHLEDKEVAINLICGRNRSSLAGLISGAPVPCTRVSIKR
ncbi:MAG: isopentenyl phosphate kinase family protein [Candidatus Lokiarchaeota archaeon]|nr:isopentenyl phosphate kinase family protein [Candidatus Lokiarchaeota archaeon]